MLRTYRLGLCLLLACTSMARWEEDGPVATDPLEAVLHGLRALESRGRGGGSPVPRFGLEPQSVLLVVQPDSRESSDTAEAYRRARNIPWRNLFRISARCPTGSVLSESEYQRYLLQPLRRHALGRLETDPVQVVLLTDSIPRETDDGRLVEVRLRCELAEVPGDQNPWFGRTDSPLDEPGAEGVLLDPPPDSQPPMVFRLPRHFSNEAPRPPSDSLWWPAREGPSVEAEVRPSVAGEAEASLEDVVRPAGASALRYDLVLWPAMGQGLQGQVVVREPPADPELPWSDDYRCSVESASREGFDTRVFCELYFEGLAAGVAAHRALTSLEAPVSIAGDPFVSASYRLLLEPALHLEGPLRIPTGQASDFSIEGERFTDREDMTVRVGGTPVDRFEVLGPERILLHLPELSPGVRDLSVQSSKGSAVAPGAVVVTPAITLVGLPARGLPLKIEFYAEPGSSFQLFAASAPSRVVFEPFGTLLLDLGADFQLLLSGKLERDREQILGVLPGSLREKNGPVYLQALVKDSSSMGSGRLTNLLVLSLD